MVENVYKLRAVVNAAVRESSSHPVRRFSHNRFEKRKGDGFAKDGVHPNEFTMKEIWSSVHGALMQILKHAS